MPDRRHARKCLLPQLPAKPNYWQLSYPELQDWFASRELSPAGVSSARTAVSCAHPPTRTGLQQESKGARSQHSFSCKTCACCLLLKAQCSTRFHPHSEMSVKVNWACNDSTLSNQHFRLIQWLMQPCWDCCLIMWSHAITQKPEICTKSNQARCTILCCWAISHRSP